MPLPSPIPKPLSDALAEVIKPAARRIGAGLLALVEAAFCGQTKSREEILLDAVQGQIAASDRRADAIAPFREIANDPNTEYQRILAREAVRHVPAERFIMPAIPIAGKIFRDSEFDESEPTIWDMWVQLLARACDRDRVGEVHPSFPWIITQLSSDEAKILDAIAPLQPREDTFADPIPVIDTTKIRIVFPDNVPFYAGHLGVLGLLVLPMGWEPTAHAVMLGPLRTYMLTDFGRSFISAVSQPKN